MAAIVYIVTTETWEGHPDDDGPARWIHSAYGEQEVAGSLPAALVFADEVAGLVADLYRNQPGAMATDAYGEYAYAHLARGEHERATVTMRRLTDLTGNAAARARLKRDGAGRLQPSEV